MNWKYNKRRNNTEDESPESKFSGIPFFINADDDGPSSQQTTGIQVVENKIFFYGDITDASCLQLNRILVEVDLKLQNTRNIFGDDFTPIIHLHLNTPGGEIFSAFATTDTIRNLKSKTYTYVDGIVASAGTLISTIGAKRFIGKHGHMLIHQLSSETYGKLSEMETDVQNCNRLMRVLKDFYKKTTKIPMKRLDELMTKDIYMEADECLQYNIVDQIL